MDAIRMCRPISKWAHTIYDPGNIAEVVRKAFKIAETEKPGVSVIELPEDVAKGEVDEKPMEPIRPRKTVRGECWTGWRWSDYFTVSSSCIGRAKVATSL